MTPKPGFLYFTVDARHLRQLGRELVADRKTALAELVKNAYDADATRVRVDFIDPSAGGVLEIRDDGEGMTLEVVREAWMRLSTAYKERQPLSARYQRIRAGQKGIGRFAAETLGRRLILSSTTEGSSTRVVVEFDWERFERPDVSLHEIGNTYHIEPTSREEHGTCLRIEGLWQAWGEEDHKGVRRVIQLLQPPFPISEAYGEEAATTSAQDPGFEVTIRVGTEDQGTQKATFSQAERERFLDASTAIVEATVDEVGRASWRVRSQRLALDEQDAFPHRLLVCGAFELHVSYFIYERGAIGDLSLKLAREMGTEYGGVRVYRDGLRVPPYGDPTNDWLRLDERSRRREVLYPFANNNWFGHVSLSRHRNLLLIDTASREGVIENEAFEELRTFVKHVLEDCGRRVARVRGKKDRARKRSLSLPESRSALVERAVHEASKAVDLAIGGRLEEARTALARASAVAMVARVSDVAAQQAEEALLGELALLRILASLGTSIVVFSHEVRSAIDTATARLNDIAEDASEAPEPWKSRGEIAAGEAAVGIERLEALAGFVEGYASRSRRRQREPQPLHAVLEAFERAFAPLAGRRSVRIHWSVDPANLRTRPMARSELDAILINLFTNALKAFEDPGQTERQILITAVGDDEELVMRFQDKGCGVPAKILDNLFEPFVTTSLASDSDLGVGTGLGLKIVYDIVEANQGSIRVATPDDGFTTCFEVRLPKAGMKGASHE